ncbi:MAG: YjbH domain-containing protein [candidate division KSB1 bacterium]|nr:YjbH domain-containing protein [candidate division KSB1 bacterium]
MTCTVLIAASTVPEHLADELARLGFENVVCYENRHGQLAVQYENRIHRDEVRALSAVLKCVDECVETEQRIMLLPVSRGMINTGISIHLTDYRAFIAREMNDATFFERIHFIKTKKFDLKSLTGQPRNTPLGKIDISVLPGMNFQLGNYEDRVKLNLNIYPDFRVRLWDGAEIQVQPVIPVFDEIYTEQGVYDKSIRLSRATLSQFLTVPGDIRMIVAAGAFVPERWGAGIEMNRMFFNRTLLMGGRLHRTGFLFYQDQEWNISTDMLTTGSAYARIFLKPWNMSAGLSYEQFLMRDEGFSFDIARYFGETRLGFYVTRTDRDTHGGFRFTIPFSHPKHSAPNRLRIRWGEYYVWNYKASSEVYTYGGPIDTGISVQSGTEWRHVYKRLWPSYLKNNLSFLK